MFHPFEIFVTANYNSNYTTSVHNTKGLNATYSKLFLEYLPVNRKGPSDYTAKQIFKVVYHFIAVCWCQLSNQHVPSVLHLLGIVLISLVGAKIISYTFVQKRYTFM